MPTRSTNQLKVDISVNDYMRLQARMARSPEVVQEKMNNTLRNIAIDMERETKMVTPKITGRLRASILTERQQLEYRIAPHTVYAEKVHERKPYMDWGFNAVEPRARQELNQMVKDIIKGI